MTDQILESAPPVQDRKEDLYTAKPWQLIWRRFSKHFLAVASLWFLVLLSLCAVFAEQVAPYDPTGVQRLRTLAPPTPIHFFHEGQFVGPFVYGLARERDAETARVIYETDTETVLPIQFWYSGDEYSFFGLFDTDFHLFGVDDRRHAVLSDHRHRPDRPNRLHHRPRPQRRQWHVPEQRPRVEVLRQARTPEVFVEGRNDF